MAVQTGLRLSEITSLRYQDLVLGTGAHVRCEGKGRKERLRVAVNDKLGIEPW
jgi:site-specific recombinase XerC